MPLFFSLTHFRELGQKYKNIFVRFLVQMKTSKFALEINWHLQSAIPYYLTQTVSSINFIFSDCNNPSFVGDGYCDDDTNNVDCEFDQGDCCGSLILTQYCHFCKCTQYSTPSWTTTANISNFYQSCNMQNRVRACNSVK